MYRPLWLNRTSEIDAMISEKKERALGSSGSSNTERGREERETHTHKGRERETHTHKGRERERHTHRGEAEGKREGGREEESTEKGNKVINVN